MRIFLSFSNNKAADAQKLTESQNSGPITLTTVTEKAESGTNYSICWINKMTNVNTKIVKLGKDSYVVEIKAPKTPAVLYSYDELRDAVMTFLINSDSNRLSATLEEKLKRIVADKIKFFENKRMLNINLKPTIRKEHKALNRPVLVGARKDTHGIMLGINWAGTRAKVAILDKKGHTVKVIELDTELLWLP